MAASELKEATALVTGGAGDIGAAIATELGRRGASIVLADIKSQEEAAPWIEQVSRQTDVRYERLDVREPAGIAALVARLPALDIAVACAGIVESAPFLDVTYAQWQRHIDVNLTGYFLVGQASARHMVSRGTPGRIVFIGSWVGEIPWPEIAAYSASKAGVRMLAKSMALELAKHQITVNVVAPGIVDAGMAKVQRQNEPAYAARIAKVIPLGVLQTPAQVADATAFLVSPAGGYITGTVLLSDGGCSLFQYAEPT